MTPSNQTLPLTYLLSPPASLDEIQLRADLVAAQWLTFAGTCRELMDNHLATVQASALSTFEQFRRSALEAAFLSSAPRADAINLS